MERDQLEAACKKYSRRRLLTGDFPAWTRWIEPLLAGRRGYSKIAEAEAAQFENKQPLRDASAEFFTSARAHPDPTVYTGLAYLNLLIGAPELAAKYLDAALALDPSYSDALVLYHHTLKSLERPIPPLDLPSLWFERAPFPETLLSPPKDPSQCMLERLPRDALTAIAQWLPAAALVNLRETCKAWKDVASADATWRALFCHRFDTNGTIIEPAPDTAFQEYAKHDKLHHYWVEKSFVHRKYRFVRPDSPSNVAIEECVWLGSFHVLVRWSDGVVDLWTSEDTQTKPFVPVFTFNRGAGAATVTAIFGSMRRVAFLTADAKLENWALSFDSDTKTWTATKTWSVEASGTPHRAFVVWLDDAETPENEGVLLVSSAKPQLTFIQPNGDVKWSRAVDEVENVLAVSVFGTIATHVVIRIPRQLLLYDIRGGEIVGRLQVPRGPCMAWALPHLLFYGTVGSGPLTGLFAVGIDLSASEEDCKGLKDLGKVHGEPTNMITMDSRRIVTASALKQIFITDIRDWSFETHRIGWDDAGLDENICAITIDFETEIRVATNEGVRTVRPGPVEENHDEDKQEPVVLKPASSGKRPFTGSKKM
jgi:hypothetical protein